MWKTDWEVLLSYCGVARWEYISQSSLYFTLNICAFTINEFSSLKEYKFLIFYKYKNINLKEYKFKKHIWMYILQFWRLEVQTHSIELTKLSASFWEALSENVFLTFPASRSCLWALVPGRCCHLQPSDFPPSSLHLLRAPGSGHTWWWWFSLLGQAPQAFFQLGLNLAL